MRRLHHLLGLVLFFTAAGCNDNNELKLLVGSYAVSVTRADLPGKMDPDILTMSIGKDSTLLMLFEVGISTDAMGMNPNGLISRVEDGMNLKLDKQAIHVDYANGVIDGSVTGDGTIDMMGTTMTLNLHVTPTNFATPDGSPTLEYSISGGKM
jgi:hypothetical protein